MMIMMMMMMVYCEMITTWFVVHVLFMAYAIVLPWAVRMYLEIINDYRRITTVFVPYICT